MSFDISGVPIEHIKAAIESDTKFFDAMTEIARKHLAAGHSREEVHAKALWSLLNEGGEQPTVNHLLGHLATAVLLLAESVTGSDAKGPRDA